MNVSTINTKVVPGSSYLISATIQAKAVNISQTAQLALRASLKAQTGGGKLTQLMITPTRGLDRNGKIIQTLQISALYTPAIVDEKLSLSVTEKTKKKMQPLMGSIQLTKVNVQTISSNE
jgi:hypothetical protein